LHASNYVVIDELLQKLDRLQILEHLNFKNATHRQRKIYTVCFKISAPHPTLENRSNLEKERLLHLHFKWELLSLTYIENFPNHPNLKRALIWGGGGGRLF